MVGVVVCVKEAVRGVEALELLSLVVVVVVVGVGVFVVVLAVAMAVGVVVVDAEVVVVELAGMRTVVPLERTMLLYVVLINDER